MDELEQAMNMDVDEPLSQNNGDAEYDELDDEFDSDNEDPNAFVIRDPLQPANAKTFSTAELHKLIHDGTIDLNPSYQRDVVWPESKQIGLIDSIFRNFYIPPVVFAVHKDEDGEDVRICVDGKQRLTSIQKFFDGQIPHRDAKTKKSFWYTTSESSKGVRLEVPQYGKTQFSEKQITCVEYYGLPPGKEREIFQRVQLGMTLTAAEKLQAISSPWAEWIVYLETRHVAVENGLSHVLEWDTKRGRDFQNLAHLVYCCDGRPDEQRLPSSQKIEKWLGRVDSPGKQFQDDIDHVLRDFWNIASNHAYNRGFKKITQRLAPVEFYFIGVLLYELRDRPMSDRAEAIYQMRLGIRNEYKDIRNNTSVSKSMWKLIDGLTMNPTKPISNQDDSKPKKKRKTARDAEDEEYRPQPIRELGKTLKTRSSKHARTG